MNLQKKKVIYSININIPKWIRTETNQVKAQLKHKSKLDTNQELCLVFLTSDIIWGLDNIYNVSWLWYRDINFDLDFTG